MVTPLHSISPDLAVGKANKLGEVPAFHSLAPLAQKLGVPIGGLRGMPDVNHGYYAKIDEADQIFLGIARDLAKRTGALPGQGAI